MTNEPTLQERLRSHECGCGGSCGQRTPAYIREAADTLDSYVLIAKEAAKGWEEAKADAERFKADLISEAASCDTVIRNMKLELGAKDAEIARLTAELRDAETAEIKLREQRATLTRERDAAREALTEAATRFRYHALEHERKGALTKAKINHEWADKCSLAARAALEPSHE